MKNIDSEKPFIEDSLNCDASFLTKNGKVMEWQVKDTLTGKIIHTKKMKGGTSNIAEFFALVEAMMLLEAEGENIPIYSDSKVALLWVKSKRCSTWEENLPQDVEELIQICEDFLKEYGSKYTTLKWDTRIWGQIPSDFERKYVKKIDK
jgi:ribonuclease HI